jgi:hypothetical protein
VTQIEDDPQKRTSSEEWALDIIFSRLKDELHELLRDHNAAEVARIIEQRRTR